MKNKISLLLYLVFLPIAFLQGQDIQYGLNFKSYEVEKENRTGLNLTPEKPFSFPDGFSLSFDVNFKPDWIHPFGSVMRIITEDRRHIDLILSEIENTGKVMISFVSPSHDIFFSKPFDKEVNYGKFIPVTLSIDIFNNKATARIGDEEFSKQISTLGDFCRVNILFGKSNYPRFQTTDVPAFILKNISINNARSAPLYKWPLSKHTCNGVYDEIRGHFATVDNGEWLLDHHAIWQKQTKIEAGENPQFCYNPDKNEIAVLDKDKFYRLDITSGRLEQNGLQKTFTYAESNSNNLIYNPITQEYNCYTFEMDKGKDVYHFDTSNNEWNKGFHSTLPPDYWQHNRFFSMTDSCLYLFCGYGHHRYKNEINRYDYKTKNWEKLSFKNDRIKPRYLSGLGQLDNQHLILFGGYGSETGNQSMSPKHFYDLYKINLRTLEARKIWEIENPQEEFVVSNSIIPDSDGKSFYALAFPLQQFYTKLSLLKFSMESPEYSIVADSIPFNFEDVKSNADLYLDKTSGQLIAVVVNSITSMTSELSVYTLSYPPLTTAELYQNTEKEVPSYLRTGIIVLLLLTAGGITLFFIRRKRKTPKYIKQLFEQQEPAFNSLATYLVTQSPKSRSVCLFGGFQVFDKGGNNITKEFTPTLKQLFVLLLLYTAKNRKGVSSAKLKDTLWYDKSDESAKNNRGVFVNKLRQVFEQIGPVNIKNQDHYWAIELDESIYCDYNQVISLMEKLNNTREKAETEDIHLLLSIVSKGEFLPNMQTDWIDSFKSDFSNNLIDLLLILYEYSAIHKDPSACIHLADTIFIHDPLNEDALSIKCHNLVQMGKHGLARKVYTTFAKEYKSLFDSDFEFSFEQVLRRDTV